MVTLANSVIGRSVRTASAALLEAGTQTKVASLQGTEALFFHRLDATEHARRQDTPSGSTPRGLGTGPGPVAPGSLVHQGVGRRPRDLRGAGTDTALIAAAAAVPTRMGAIGESWATPLRAALLGHRSRVDITRSSGMPARTHLRGPQRSHVPTGSLGREVVWPSSSFDEIAVTQVELVESDDLVASSSMIRPVGGRQPSIR